jgi:Cu(I)/Ag(I) efflux system membrane protein CusA/SilA
MKMPAMTMAFNVADKKMLKGIKAGDKVRFKLEAVKGQALVTQLERSK